MDTNLRSRPLIGWLVTLEAIGRTGLALSQRDVDRDRFVRVLDIVSSQAGLAFFSPPVASSLPRLHNSNDASIAARYTTPKLRASIVIVSEHAGNTRVVLDDRDELLHLPGDFVDIGRVPAQTAYQTAANAGFRADTLQVIAVLDRLRSRSGMYGPSYEVVFAAHGTAITSDTRTLDLDDARERADSDVERVLDIALSAVRGEPFDAVLDLPRPSRNSPRSQSPSDKGAGNFGGSSMSSWLEQLSAVAVEGQHDTETSDYDRDRYRQLSSIIATITTGVPFLDATDTAAIRTTDLVQTCDASTPKICISVAIVDDESRLLLMQRSATGQWDYVSGYADPGYSALEVANKEIDEELGISVQIAGLLGIVDGRRASHGTDGDISTVALLARPVDGRGFDVSRLRVDTTEARDLRWFGLEELPRPLSGALNVMKRKIFASAVQLGSSYFDDLPPGDPMGLSTHGLGSGWKYHDSLGAKDGTG